MNYYNPYYLMNPIGMTGTPRFFSGLSGRSGLTFGAFLDGAQRTLGLVNQAIPIIKEATPMMRNAKTMFRVMNEFKKIDTPSDDNSNTTTFNKNYEKNENSYQANTGGPTFFI